MCVRPASLLNAYFDSTGEAGLRDHEHMLIARAESTIFSSEPDTATAAWCSEYRLRRATYHSLSSKCLNQLNRHKESWDAAKLSLQIAGDVSLQTERAKRDRCTLLFELAILGLTTCREFKAEASSRHPSV